MKITLGYFRNLLNQLDSDEISMSRMVELLNERAAQPEPTPEPKKNFQPTSNRDKVNVWDLSSVAKQRRKEGSL